MNTQTSSNADIYVVDIRATVIPNPCNQSLSQASWMLSSSVLLPVEELIEFVIEAHQTAAKQLERDIRVAYVQGLWPNHLSANKIRLAELGGLDKLAQKMPTAAIALAHQDFVHAAADVASFAQADNVEAAYEVLDGAFVRTSQKLVSLLQAGMPLFAKPSARSLPALPA
jgi:hypothetical protein